MQKVVGSSPIIRSSKSPAQAGFLLSKTREQSYGEGGKSGFSQVRQALTLGCGTDRNLGGRSASCQELEPRVAAAVYAARGVGGSTALGVSSFALRTF